MPGNVFTIIVDQRENKISFKVKKKMLARPSLKKKKLIMVVHFCNSRFLGGDRRIGV
jgi:hypothetical protein